MGLALRAVIVLAAVGTGAAADAGCFVDKAVIPANHPYLMSLSPSTVVAGGAAFTLTINGYGLQPADIISWNGAPKTTTFVSDQRLTTQIDAADIAVAKMVPVAVYRMASDGLTYDQLWLLVKSPTP